MGGVQFDFQNAYQCDLVHRNVMGEEIEEEERVQFESPWEDLY